MSSGTEPDAPSALVIREDLRDLHLAAPPPARRGVPPAGACVLEATVLRGIERLRAGDPVLYELLPREHQRQAETLMMVAASSAVHPAVLACEGSALINTTTEGYPGARFHAGCGVVDQVERIARLALSFRRSTSSAT